MRNSRIYRNVRLGIKNLMLHKLRSMLTMLGVVFGVASVVAMLAVGEGASEQALSQIRKLGSNNIIITSVKSQDTSAGTMHARVSIYGLLYADRQRIEEDFDAVRQVVPVKAVRKDGRLGDRSVQLRVVGTTPAWFELVKREVLAGRVLAAGDMNGGSNAVVLTEAGARKLLATSHTIGQSVRIGKNYYQVIGIVRSEHSSGSIQTPDRDTDAYIPLPVARQRFGDMMIQRSSGSTEWERVELTQIVVQVASLDEVESAAAAIEAMLQRFHDRRDYRMEVPLALLQQAQATKRTFNIVLGSIAGISLLVGGIGIMNIMLASVTERTREIGIRRAIGARRQQIVAQFLIETMVLSTAGGMIGMAMGMFIPFAISYFAGMPTVVTFFSLALSVTISVGIGVLFGIYPAYRAAQLDPIIALRHE